MPGRERNPAFLFHGVTEAITRKSSLIQVEFPNAVARLLNGVYDDQDLLTLSMATVNPHRLQMENGIGALIEGLNPDSPSHQPARAFTALVIADFLDQQEKRPLFDRAWVGSSRAAYRAVGVHLSRRQEEHILTKLSEVFIPREDQEESQIKALSNAATVFKNSIATLPKNPTSKEDVKQWHPLIRDHALPRAFVLGAHLRHLWGTEGKEEIMSLIDNLTISAGIILRSPYVTELLLEGELDDLDPYDRLSIALYSRDFTSSRDDQERAMALLEYFFSHPDVQEAFWNHEAGVINTAITQRFLLGDELTVRFLSTIPENYTPEKKALLVEQLIIAAAHIKNTSRNNPRIADQVAALSEKLDAIPTQTLAILQDQIPGVILLVQQDTGFRSRINSIIPRPGQTKEAFLRRVNERRAEVAYESSAPWPEPQAPQRSTKENGSAQKPGTREPERVVARITRALELRPWGRINAIDPVDMAPVFAHVNGLLTKYHVTQDKAFDALVDVDSQVRSGINSSLVILPDLLPLAHPLAVLSKIGIVGVREEPDYDFIFEPGRADVECDAVRVVAFSGQIIDGELKMTFIEREQTANTPLHLLLNAAALLARAHFTDEVLTKEELSEVRSHVKAHNQRAKAQGHPQVRFDEDPTKRDPNLSLTVTFVGKKPVLLSVIPIAA